MIALVLFVYNFSSICALLQCAAALTFEALVFVTLLVIECIQWHLSLAINYLVMIALLVIQIVCLCRRAFVPFRHRHHLEPVKPFNPPCLRHKWVNNLQPSEYNLVDPENWEGTRAWTESLGWPVLLILPRPKEGQTGQAAVSEEFFTR